MCWDMSDAKCLTHPSVFCAVQHGDFRRLEPSFSPSKNFLYRTLQFTFGGRRRQHLRSWTRSQRDVWVRPNNLES